MSAVAELPADSATEHLFAAIARRPAALHVAPATPVWPASGPAPSAAAPVPSAPAPAPSAPAPSTWVVPATAADGTPRRTSAARPLPPAPSPRPRAHLVTAPPPARRPVATGPAGGPPPTLTERVRVLRAGDRTFVVEARDADEDEDRPARPAADPEVVVRRLATASVEVIAGIRPAAQLTRWLAPGVLDALRLRAGLTRRSPLRACRMPMCRGVRVWDVGEHAVEATVVVDDGRRVRAVAVRLEGHRGAWRATALEVG